MSVEVSVVIPTRGRVDLLSCAVATALGQGVDVEVVVVEEGYPCPAGLSDAAVPRSADAALRGVPDDA